MDSAASSPVFQEGEAHMAAGRLDLADAAYRQALEDNGAHADTLNRLGLIAAQRNDHDEALAMMRRACEVDGWKTPTHKQNLVALLSHVAAGRANAGDDEDAMALAREAARHTDDLPQLREQVVEVLYQLGRRHLHAAPAAAVPPLRLAVRTLPGNPHVRNLWSHALTYSGEPAELADFNEELAPEDLAVRPFIACFPKSGSTLLKTLLCAATGFPDSQLTYGFQQNEEELYLPYVAEAATKPGVTQLHCRATEPNLHLMQAFGLRPVILVRNIFDVLLSYKEFYDLGAWRNTFFRDYDTFDDEQRLDLIVDDRAPWYFAFFASWHDAVARGRVEAHWLTYEALSEDKRAAVEQVLAFYGLGVPPVKIAHAIAQAEGEKHQTRFNKGQVGRGTDAFTQRHRDRIARLAAYYPSVDFSLIGL